jgi:hypothetical protein
LQKWILLAATVAVAACEGIEFNITDANPVSGEVNPPALEAPVKLDRIVQVTKQKVDTLFVIDNSCSMEEEQIALSNNFDQFIGYFVGSGLDWHVGVVSTDMDDPNHSGKLRSSGGYRFLDESVPSPLDMFETMAHMGTSGSWNEKGREAAYSAIEVNNDTHNAGFYREEARLSVVLISDEQDYSNAPSINEFISWLLNLKEDDEQVTFSSIVNLPDPPCPPDSFGYPPEIGDDYIAITSAVGGLTWPICESDWSDLLNELGMQAAGLKREFFLSDVPVASTIDVWVEEPSDDGGNTYSFRVGTDYEYSPTRNSIKFHTYVPKPLSVVNVEYELLAARTGTDGDTGDTGQ